jgi:peptidyl-prolyl cis-trans isomerase D
VDVFTRQGGGDLGAERKLIEAAFSEDVLQARQNSPAINQGDDAVVVLRVTDHRPPAQRSLEEVRGEVEAALRQKAARDAAQAAAKAGAARVAAGESWQAVTAALGVEPGGVATVTRGQEGVPPELLKAVFATAAPATGRVASGTAALPEGDAALFVVSAVRPGSLASPEAAAALAETAQQAAARAALGEYSAYVTELERTAKVTRNPKVFE